MNEDEKENGNENGNGDSTGTGSPEPDREVPEVGETIPTEEARTLLGRAQAVAIDIRDEDAFRDGRIPNADNVPEGEIEERIDDLPRDKVVLVACQDGERSREVAGRLRERDINATAIEGGMDNWFSDKQPAQPSDDPDEDARV